MNIRQLEQDHLQDAANVLVLSPLTPWGTAAYFELLSTMCPNDANLAVVTYTQPPDLWMADWSDQGHDLPTYVSFIHGGPAEGPSGVADDDTVSLDRVSPRDPMDIITAVTAVLEEDGTIPAVVSVQTLTVLLEYVDFNTAFRYLHVLIHRIRGAEALGYYQMDPSIHEAETINTLSVLFDVVVRPEADDQDGISWTVVSAMPASDEPLEDDELAIGPMHLPDETRSTRSWFSSKITSLIEPFWTDEPDSAPPTPPVEPETVPASDHANDTQSDEELLTDEERIQRLLVQAGGRMSQADIVESTHWSGPSVSRKLSAMEADGLITRVQVGRGNLVFLDGHQPDIHGSTASPNNDE